MRDLTNDNVIYLNKDGIDFLQFKVLNELGVKNAYLLKNECIDLRRKNGVLQDNGDSIKKICDTFDIDISKMVFAKQFHTDNVVLGDKKIFDDYNDFFDGGITDSEEITLATTNADCILYFVYDKSKRIIANVHSGWKGSYLRIIEKTIDKMVEVYNSSLEDLIVCICPSIRKCCFEVDEDVRNMFVDKFSFLKDINKFILNGYQEGKYYIDTVGINNCLLINKGVKPENIYDSGICSVCNDDLIHSFRSEGKNYQLAAAIISL